MIMLRRSMLYSRASSSMQMEDRDRTCVQIGRMLPAPPQCHLAAKPERLDAAGEVCEDIGNERHHLHLSASAARG